MNGNLGVRGKKEEDDSKLDEKMKCGENEKGERLNEKSDSERKRGKRGNV